MNKIKILSDDVANRIAAGEVIERPASVVKECVENSIDAGATEIIIKIINGGRDLIQIIDNGYGMSENDAFLAFERHATSKINTSEDIVHINTMGFRGEALPSIASVSHFQIITKTADDSIATEINYSGGKLESMSKTASKTGTSISVKNLFYNVPARRKFLKSEPVEYKHILNYIHYQSVLFPEISFVLYSNNKEKFNYPIVDNLEKRMLDVFGTPFTKQNFIYVNKVACALKIYGYLQDVDHNNQNNLLEAHYLYVNRRFINDKTVYAAIKSAYEPFLKKYRFFEKGKLPNYILFIDITPEEIDVNVHPAKTEIRFRNQGAVFQFVKDAVFECLHNNELERYENTRLKLSSLPLATPLTKSEEVIAEEIFKAPDKNINSSNINLHITERRRNKDYQSAIYDDNDNSNEPQQFVISTSSKGDLFDALTSKFDLVGIDTNQTVYTVSNEDSVGMRLAMSNSVGAMSPSPAVPNPVGAMSPSPALPNPARENHQNDQYMILKTMRDDFVQMWQLHDTYIFIQVDDGLVIFDQHAAHERILYEKLLRNIDQRRPNKQKLVFPLVIDLPNYMSESVKDIIEKNDDIFDSLGFTVKLYSGNSIVIDEIPSELGYWDGGNIFIEILKQLEDELQSTTDFRIASAAAVACKASIKAGQKMNKREMHELITELFTCDFPFQCPHGRPLIVKITMTMIEKMFKRIV